MPDIERTDLLVVMGANPAASQGSLLAAPDVMGDHRRNSQAAARSLSSTRSAPRTAARADEWLPITPGTDAALLLAVAHTLFAEDLVDLGDVEPHVDGVDRMRDVGRRRGRRSAVAARHRHRPRTASARWPASWPAPNAPRCTAASACATRSSAALASWLVDVVNILTGHFDTRGRLDVPARRAWSVTVLPMPGLEDGAPEFGRWPHPRPRRQRGARPGAGVVPGRGDRDAGGGPDQGARSPSRATPCCRRRRGHKLDEALPTLDA